MTIDILIPAHNVEETINQAIKSIINQINNNWNCIIIDDGSTDNTQALIRDAIRDDNRFVFIQQKQSGLIAALNVGLRACRGELVARLDADDRAAPERLQKQAEMFEKHPGLTLASCRVRCFSDAGEVPEGMRLYEEWLNGLMTHDEIVRDIFVESPFAHPSVMYRREVVMAVGGYQDRGWPEDYDLWMRLWMAGAKFAKCAEVLLEWRDSPGRLSRTADAYSLMNFRRLKLHYLLLTYLRDRREVTLWGAGRGGRWWGGELTRAGIRVRRYIDIDPRKIGRRRGAAPVEPPDALREHLPGDFILGVVESRGARALIRAQLLEMDYVELEDFLFVA